MRIPELLSRLRGNADRAALYRFIKRTQTNSLRDRKRRSVLFLHNSYYHFYYLAQALRRRGWDAISVSYEDPINGPNKNYYHGEDVNLFSPDPIVFRQNIEELYVDSTRRFALVHIAGDGLLSFFPELWEERRPRDIVSWRKTGKKVAYTISGCNSCVSQSAFAEWSALDNGRIACNKCVWQHRPDICSDAKNLAWGKKVDEHVDLICAETCPALDFLDSPRTVFDPLTMCLDPIFWDTDLRIPEEFKIARKEENEVLVFHSVGNYQARTSKEGRNIKGTSAVFTAVERLQSERLPVRLIFETNMSNFEIRYIQAQADIIVDQLNFGRYGAICREGMMLGKPVICYINKHGKFYPDRMHWIEEVPVISATEETLYGMLKDLVLNKDKRIAIGTKSREYALKWHSAESCAERYEMVYDRLMAGKP